MEGTAEFTRSQRSTVLDVDALHYGGTTAPLTRLLSILSELRANVSMLQIQAEAQAQRLVTSRVLLSAAQASRTAVAALNFYNAETLLAHVRAANALHATINLQTTESTID